LLINSGTFYYAFGTWISIFLFPKSIAILSILYLAIGDPVASIFGIQFKTESFLGLKVRLRTGKSLIGTLAASLLCGTLTYYILNYYTFLPSIIILIISVVGGLSAGIAETIIPIFVPIDDNFIIPIVSGFSLWFTCNQLFVSPHTWNLFHP
jgi:diacylglycerol kinase (CTP)